MDVSRTAILLSKLMQSVAAGTPLDSSNILFKFNDFIVYYSEKLRQFTYGLAVRFWNFFNIISLFGIGAVIARIVNSLSLMSCLFRAYRTYQYSPRCLLRSNQMWPKNRSKPFTTSFTNIDTRC